MSLEVKEFTELLGTDTNRYGEIRDVVRELRKKEVIIDAEEGEIITGWLSSIQNKSGVIELEFSQKLILYLLQLKNRFTSYQLKNILYLKNKHSIRIYELLKQYKNRAANIRQFNLIEFKKTLMLEENQYDRFYDFDRFVLKPSMEEINEFTDINIKYEKITKGRKITGIKYIVDYSTDDDSYIEYLNESYNISEFKLKSGLENEHFDSKQIIEIITIATEVLTDAEQEDLFETIYI